MDKISLPAEERRKIVTYWAQIRSPTICRFISLTLWFVVRKYIYTGICSTKVCYCSRDNGGRLRQCSELPSLLVRDSPYWARRCQNQTGRRERRNVLRGTRERLSDVERFVWAYIQEVWRNRTDLQLQTNDVSGDFQVLAFRQALETELQLENIFKIGIRSYRDKYKNKSKLCWSGCLFSEDWMQTKWISSCLCVKIEPS